MFNNLEENYHSIMKSFISFNLNADGFEFNKFRSSNASRSEPWQYEIIKLLFNSHAAYINIILTIKFRAAN